MSTVGSAADGGFPSIYECSCKGREAQTVVSVLEGTLLRDTSSFPYFMLLAWDAPAGLARFAILLLLWPAVSLLHTYVSESAAIKLMVFVSCIGAKETDIASTARAVLPKFYVEDVHPRAWHVVSSFSSRYLLTAAPRIMVEPFAKEFLGIQKVLGSELHISASLGRRATGFLRSPGVLVGHNRAAALHERFGASLPDVGLGDRASDSPFLAACKDGYVVPPFSEKESLSPSQLFKPLIFHDGRLVSKPTPRWALFILAWLPFGILLACIRVFIGSLLPVKISYYLGRMSGMRLIIKGKPPSFKKHEEANGVLFVSTHRTLMDPLFLSLALRRPIPALAYSTSRVSQILSPIPNVMVHRDKQKDARLIKKYLKQGDLHMCPEGTTCREPFLLRFSALFAELTTRVVPVAINCHVNMFHATTARGWKGLDSFYFCMNPTPCYEITFLEELPLSLTCHGGKTSYEVANYVQQELANVLNFQTTKFTRKDKYGALVGNDASISASKKTLKKDR